MPRAKRKRNEPSSVSQEMSASDIELIGTFIDLSNRCIGLEESQLIQYLIKVDQTYKEERDTELGQFIIDWSTLVASLHTLRLNNDPTFSKQFDELHQTLQDLIDDAELNPDMLMCVGHHMLVLLGL